MAAVDTVSVGGSLCASVSVFAGVQLSADCKGKHQVWPLLNLPHLRRSPVMGRVESMKHVGCRPEENKCMNTARSAQREPPGLVLEAGGTST